MIHSLADILSSLLLQISDILDRCGIIDGFLRTLKQQDGEATAFSDNLLCGLLDYAITYADGHLIFTFKNGFTFEGSKGHRKMEIYSKAFADRVDSSKKEETA